MTAAVQLPLWPFGVVFIALCFAPDAAGWVRARLRARRSEARRLRALDALWSDEVAAGGESVAPSSSVSRGLTATTGGDIYPWPRETIYARSGPGGDAA